jgi:hypothetical protein
MSQLIIGIVLIVSGVVLTTFGGYVAKDAWDTLKSRDKGAQSSADGPGIIKPGSVVRVPDQINKETDPRASSQGNEAAQSSADGASVIKPGSEGPLPDHIIQDIDSRPPFQRNEVAQNYVGMKVKWRLTFHSVHKISDTTV